MFCADRVAGLGEEVREDALAEDEDGADDDGGDAGDQQAVLHGGGAALVTVGPEPGRRDAEQQAEQQLGDEDEHRGLLGAVAVDLASTRSTATNVSDELTRSVGVLIEVLVLLNALCRVPPRTKTMPTMTAAMPATSRPYSTAEAPRSSILARRALIMMRR